MKKFLVSVIIPSYNHACFIGDALRSVFAQTRPPDEVIVADDGSTDDTVFVAEGFGSAVMLIQGNHEGIAANYNRALEKCRGEFVAFLESDDMLVPNYIESAMAFLEKHPDTAWLTTARMVIDGAGRKTGETYRKRTLGTIFTTEDILLKNWGVVSTPVVNREKLLAAGHYDTTLVFGCDIEMALRFSLNNKMAYLDEPLYLYRRHSENTTKSLIATNEESLNVIRRFTETRPAYVRSKRRLFRRILAKQYGRVGSLKMKHRRELSIARREILPYFYNAISYNFLALRNYIRIARLIFS